MWRETLLYKIFVGIITFFVIFIIVAMPAFAHAQTIYPTDNPNTNPVQETYLTGPQIDQLLKGTELYGLGVEFALGEAQTGVNSLFVVAICEHESARGTSSLAYAQNNLGGIKAWRVSGQVYQAFDTRAQCVSYMFGLLYKYSACGLHTIDDIGRVYCTTNGWAKDVRSILQNLVNRAKEA